ncbi:uncharacterized protein [Tenebrio molitor]|uniref:uncharacterized protein isoform X2 n=1 Tax=Tenebrio molitor TaxID=7067 RepID=UPI0036248993
MGLSNVQLLLVVNFLSSLSCGIVAPSFSLHVMMHGGNQIILGFLAAFTYICTSIGKDVIGLFEHGKKHAITFAMFVMFLVYFTLVFYDSCWILVTLRLVYALANQINPISKELVTRTEPQDKVISYFNFLDIMKVSGMVVGAISGGYIFQCNEDFTSNAMFSTVFSLAGLLVLQQMDNDDINVHRPESRLASLPFTCYQQVKSLGTIDYKDHWDAILLHTAFVTVFTVLFTRFIYLLCYNYKVGSVVVGYTTAYYHMWLFASSCIVPFVKGLSANKKSMFEHALLLCAVSVVSQYHAPNYECFLVVMVPLLFTYTLVNSLAEDDVLDLKSDEQVYQAKKTIVVLLNIIVPIWFGFVCHFFSGRAFKVLSMLPPVVVTYMINQRLTAPSRRRVQEQQEEEAEGVKED